MYSTHCALCAYIYMYVNRWTDRQIDRDIDKAMDSASDCHKSAVALCLFKSNQPQKRGAI